jgi:hypothetical protein
MSVVNATDILAAANANKIEQAAPTDESLNAGAFLPDEPIADVLTNEVAGDSNVIMEMLPKLNEEPAEPATESIYNDLSYLRTDLLNQRGMSQKIATEALAVMPHFGKGLPVNFYSRHPSPTGYKAALEEIEDGMQSDLLSHIAAQINRLQTISANPGNGFALENLDFKRRADQISMQAAMLKEFSSIAVSNGFQWDDACFRGCAVDPSKNAVVPSILGISTKLPYSFADMDDYYQAHMDAPAMMELMTTHLVQWRGVFAQVLEALTDNADKIKVDVPKAPTVYFSFGRKTTSIENIGDVFRSAEDKIAPPAQDKDTLTLIEGVSNAAQQARVVDILLRAKAYAKTADELVALLQAISGQLMETPNVNAIDSIYKLISAFARVNQAMATGYGEMLKWCVNAGMATSYVGVLTASVVEFAWKSIQQCRDTMQMRESTYLQLKCLVEDLQAAVKTNAV